LLGFFWYSLGNQTNSKLFLTNFAFKLVIKKVPKNRKKLMVFKKQDLLGQVSRLRKREGQKYVNFYGKS